MSVNIMPCRYQELLAVLSGYQKTGVPLIAYKNDTLIPSFSADDIGLYCIIPKLATFFNNSLDTTLLVFFYGIMIIAAFVGMAAFIFMYNSYTQRIIACLGIISIFFISHSLVDVYKIPVALNIALIPWSLYFAAKKDHSMLFYLFVFSAGLVIGFAHYLRSFAGGAAALFLVTIIVTHQVLSTKTKILLLSLFSTGMLIPHFYYTSLYKQHKQYVTTTLHSSLEYPQHHVFWHQVYLGLGFLSNEYNIIYRDECAWQKTRSLNHNVTYGSIAYEKELRTEVIKIITENPRFFLHTLWAKIGVLLLYLLLFANIGLCAAYVYPKNWRVELAFLLALLFSGLPAIVAIPLYYYLFGFISCCIVYNIVSINQAIARKM